MPDEEDGGETSVSSVLLVSRGVRWMCEEMRAWAERMELGFKGKQASWETMSKGSCGLQDAAGLQQ